MADYKVDVRQHNAWQQPVEDKDLTTPPGAPSKGDRYIVSGGLGEFFNEDCSNLGS